MLNNIINVIPSQPKGDYNNNELHQLFVSVFGLDPSRSKSTNDLECGNRANSIYVTRNNSRKPQSYC